MGHREARAGRPGEGKVSASPLGWGAKTERRRVEKRRGQLTVDRDGVRFNELAQHRCPRHPGTGLVSTGCSTPSGAFSHNEASPSYFVHLEMYQDFSAPCKSVSARHGQCMSNLMGRGSRSRPGLWR